MMDISRYMQPPVQAAQCRLWLSQKRQRFAFSEMHNKDSRFSLVDMQHMQANAYAEMQEAMQALEWFHVNHIVDVIISDEASLKRAHEQRVHVENLRYNAIVG